MPPSFAFTLDALKSARRCPLLGRAHGDGVILLGPKKGRVEEMRVYEAVDTTAIAQGMGAQGLTVRSLGDLDRIRPWIAHPTGPLVVDCKVNPQVQANWVREAFGKNPVH